MTFQNAGDATPSRPSVPVIGPAPTQPVRFLGDPRAFWRLLARGAVLLAFTLGIYRFWLATDQRRFLYRNFAGGTWEKVEHWGEITGTVNRSITIAYGATGIQLVDDTSLDPNTPDAHEAVRAWIDLPPQP